MHRCGGWFMAQKKCLHIDVGAQPGSKEVGATDWGG